MRTSTNREVLFLRSSFTRKARSSGRIPGRKKKNKNPLRELQVSAAKALLPEF
jgi:hypothetical protein